jgi:dUTP pyrophosphatase
MTLPKDACEVAVGGTGALPEYGSAASAGADLRAAEAVALGPGERVAVATGIHVAIPPGHVGLVWPRSGLALRHGIDTLAGVIDSDYRGEVKVVLVNHGHEAVRIEAGDRVAQLLIQRVERAVFTRTSDLGATERGAGGFGSTGR